MKSLSLSKPHMIIIVGIAGAGKSFFANQFAHTFQAPLVSRSTILESFHGHGLSQKAQEDISDSIIRTSVRELLKTKQSIIIDANCDTRTDRAEFVRLARSAGYEPLLIWVQTEPLTAKQRATRPNKQQQTPARMTPEEHDAAVRKFTTPNAAEKAIVISGKHTYASQAKIVLTKLAKPRQETLNTQVTPPARKSLAGRITIR